MKIIKSIIFLIIVLCIIFTGNSIIRAAEADVVWTRTHNGSGNDNDKGNGIAVDSSGNVYVTGEEHNGINYDIWVRKYDKDGNVIREVTHDNGGTDRGNDIAVDTSGNVYVTGYETVVGEGNNIWVCKFSNNGIGIWTNTYNGVSNSYDKGNGIAVDNSGNVYVTGYITTGTGNDIWVCKFDNNGNGIWTNTYTSSGSFSDRGKGIAVDTSGNVYVTGDEYVIGEGNNIWVCKFSNNGIGIWTNTYNGNANNSDLGNGIAVDTSGNVYVTGYEHNGANYDIWVRKYDTDGNTDWTRTYNGVANGYDKGNGIAVDNSGNVYVTGYEHNGLVQYHNIWVRKYDTDGNTIWTRTYNGADNDDKGNGIAVDTSGNVYVTGYEEVAVCSSDIWIRKYSCNLEIGSGNLSKPQTGEIYQADFTATGGTAPYEWSLASGSLPLGLTLYPDGAISGIPLSDDEAVFTVKVEESFGGIDEHTFTVNSVNNSIASGKIKVIGGENGYVNPDKNEQAKIIFNAKQSGNVKVKIYTLSGQLVKEISQDVKEGINTVYWNGLNKENKKVATGIYIVFINGAGIDTSSKVAVGR